MKAQIILLCSVLSVVLAERWLSLYACDPVNGDYSIINPDPANIHRAQVLNSGTDCQTSFTDDYRIFNVTNCRAQTLNLMLDHGSTLSAAIMGGSGSDVFLASCDKKTYGVVTEIIGEARVVDLSTDAGFDEEFVDSAPQVQVVLKSAQAAVGYTLFTVGYPMTVELIGPAGTKMLPKECVAYSGHVEDDGTRLNKTTIQNGCSLDKSLVYDFKEDYTSWYAEGLPDLGELPVAAILDTEGQASEEQPYLAANIFAFRWSNSNKMRFHCDVILCPSESEDCDFVSLLEPRHEKTNNVGFEQVRHKPSCTITEDGWRLHILGLESTGIVLLVQRKQRRRSASQSLRS